MSKAKNTDTAYIVLVPMMEDIYEGRGMFAEIGWPCHLSGSRSRQFDCTGRRRTLLWDPFCGTPSVEHPCLGCPPTGQLVGAALISGRKRSDMHGAA